MLEMRRLHPWWGPRRIRHELIKADVEPLPSESGVYRALVRAGLIDPDARRPRAQTWKRWERGHPMELWQMDLVGGFAIADDSHAKALSGVDDHSRFCVSARLMPRERTLPVCDGLRAAMAAHGEPQQILTDNGKVFTGRYGHPPVEVLFDRICREHGIEHLLTKPRSPTTTGKIERFHRSLRAEFDTTQVFNSIKTAQQALDEWVTHYNHDRPHQSLDMATPAEKFYHRDNPTEPNDAAKTTTTATVTPRTVHPTEPRPAQPGQAWVSRRVASNGVVCVSWQQVCVGKHRAGPNDHPTHPSTITRSPTGQQNPRSTAFIAMVPGRLPYHCHTFLTVGCGPARPGVRWLLWTIAPRGPCRRPGVMEGRECPSWPATSRAEFAAWSRIVAVVSRSR